MMTKPNKILLFLTVLILTSIYSCSINSDSSNDNSDTDVEPIELSFTTNNHYILKNNIPFQVKGVVYVPGYPGYLPWEIENSVTLTVDLKNSITEDITNIKAMGANTVRFWGAPKYCYEALKNIDNLYFIQTIWINGEVADFQNSAFKEESKSYIRAVIDKIYAVYQDNKPPLIAYLVGNELSEASIIATDNAHPEINSFSGDFITTTSNITATEAFIAEMADYTKTYEYSTYGNVSLVSYANDIRTFDVIDTPFLDFRSHNAYSYAVPYYRPNTNVGSNSGTLFQGWIEEIKSKHPNVPLLITETGLSVSPNAQHIGPPNFGYGGNTETEQANGLIQNISDIANANQPITGVCIHEYLDAWWKFGLEDSYSQDPNDIEEWFGIVKLNPDNNWYATEIRPIYEAIQNIW